MLAEGWNRAHLRLDILDANGWNEGGKRTDRRADLPPGLTTRQLRVVDELLDRVDAGVGNL